MRLRTKIDSWLESVIEAGWLAALIVAPLFFNVFSSRVFEPDKVSLIRSIALIMLLAWVVKLLNGGPAWLPGLGRESFGKDGDKNPGKNSASGGSRASGRQASGDAQADAQADEDGDGRRSGLGWVSDSRRRGVITFLVPIGLLVVSYLISTALSVAPFVSWWGSYQRLQGTYTFISYIIIALLTLAHLRESTQLRRLQHTIILTSLPIGIYGIIQHYALDPLPWGGDVTTRVAANAGNAIFLAAYLIMAFFFTLERAYSSFAFLLGKKTSPAASSQDLPVSLAGGAYLFIMMVQLLSIFWTQSRGPWLGLFAGLYLFVLLLFVVLRPRFHRLLTTSWIGIGIGGVALLIAVNTLPVFEPLREMPYVERFTTLLESDEGTGRVRILIWEGAAAMVAPHEPLHFPDGSRDRVNFIRPLVGYGPEAMWIAYNPFYPPELAHVEARNASPDRSHNETWDALVVTGILGFVAYIALFITIFYWSLRWLGLLFTRFHGLLFGAIMAVSIVVMVVLFYLYDDGWRYFGAAIPVGLLGGLGLYVTLATFFKRPIDSEAGGEVRTADEDPETEIQTEVQTETTVPEPNGLFAPASERARHLLIIAILSTLVAHFVEIHFGISIAASRTYFWVYTALLLVLGMRWVEPYLFGAGADAAQTATAGPAADVADAPSVASVEPPGSRNKGRRRGGRTVRSPEGSGYSGGRGGREGTIPTLIMTDVLIFLTLVFIYTTNTQGLNNGLSILFASITQRVQGGAVINSPAILFLLIFTWLIAATLALVSASLQRPQAPSLGWWLRGYGIHAVIVWAVWFVYGAIQGSRLTQSAAGTTLDSQLNQVAGHFAVFTWIVVIWMLVAGAVYAWPWLRERRIVLGGRVPIAVGAGAALAIGVLVIINSVNVALVRADIIYKQGQQFDNQGAWVDSTELYRRALDARRTEDHYMLFLGRSLLEHAKSRPVEGTATLSASPDLAEVLALTPQMVSEMGRNDLLRAAETVLIEAQDVNPLNTDHTANLARLYRTWADLTDDPEARQALLDRSLEAYDLAVVLSPNAAHLWNEKGNAHMARGERDEAEAAFLHSFGLDQLFDQTYVLLADFYEQQGDDERVIEILQQGIEARPRSAQLPSYLGVVLARQGDLQGAIEANLSVLELQPNNLGAMRNLALLYRDLNQLDEAAEWAETAIAGTNPNNVADLRQLHQLAAQIYQTAGEVQMVIEQYEHMRTLEPENTTTLRTLYSLYVGESAWNEAIGILQNLSSLEPDNFEHPLGLAQILQQVGQIENAMAFATQALALAPDEQKPVISSFIETLDTGG